MGNRSCHATTQNTRRTANVQNKKGVTNKLGKAVGASGDVGKMAEALAKYKEVKAELAAPPAKKVLDLQLNELGLNY